MSVAELAVQAAIDKMKSLIEAQKTSSTDPAIANAWGAAAEAVDAVATKKGTIAELGDLGLERILSIVAGGPDYHEDLKYLAEQASADQIIHAVETGTGRLEADTAARERRRKDLLDLAGQIGVIGAKLLLSILL